MIIPIIKFTENSKKYICNNDLQLDINLMHIDGDIIPKNSTMQRCDYGYSFELNDTMSICLVELKGCDIEHACIQLLTTLQYFEKLKSADIFYCRAVLSKYNKPSLPGINEKKLSHYLKSKHYPELKKQTKQMNDVISKLS